MHRDRPTDSAFHDFLAVEHRDIGFLINRDQFFASVYLEEIDPLPEPETVPAYCAGTMIFRQETLLLFTLDKKLGDLFDNQVEDGLSIALIADVGAFSEEHRQNFLDMVEEAAPEASKEMIAFRIGSQAEIKSIPLHHIRMIPETLRAFLRDRGILGCRFSGNRDIYFLVDIETITFGGITKT